MTKETQAIIDQIAHWDAEQIEEVLDEVQNLLDVKIENLPDDDEGF